MQYCPECGCRFGIEFFQFGEYECTHLFGKQHSWGSTHSRRSNSQPAVRVGGDPIPMRSLLAFLCFLWLSTGLFAQTYTMTGSVPFLGDQTYWDYLIADASSHRLYVTRETEVLVVDLATMHEAARIKNLKRVHGIALAHDLNKGFLTDGGDNAVVVFDLKSNAITQKIQVGNAPDAIVYEPTKKRVYVFNAHSHSTSVIDAATGTIVTTVSLPGSPEFAATDGRGNVYVNIETRNSLVRFDQDGTQVLNEWSLAPCKQPSGLAMDAEGRRLFSVCSNDRMMVTDADSGKRVAEVPIGEDPDAAGYDAERKLVFSSNSDSTLTVIKEETPDKYRVSQTVKTEREARTMAVDAATHKVYLSCAKVAPGERETPDPDTLPKFVPGTFHLIVVSPETP